MYTCKSPFGIGMYTYTDPYTGKKETGYGFWNGENPNDFFPDFECCTEQEIKNWQKACDEYNNNKEELK